MIYKKDFEIRSRRTGNQLKDRENEYEYYIVYLPTQKKLETPKFYTFKSANKWLSETIKTAKIILKNREVTSK